jgi:hypothetical protein
MSENTKTSSKRSRRRKILWIVLYVLIGLALILIPLNLYGRQPFDPAGSDTVSFNPKDLKPGRNTVEYLSNGSKISAHLFIPEDYVEGEGYGLRFGHKFKQQPGSGMLSVLAVSASELAYREDLPEPGCTQTSLAV